MDTNSNILVSIIVLGFNQESYIRQAIEGAFAQTYSPLEIILSDDCSTDRTFAIMRELSAKFQGAHKVILNRNTTNLGPGGNLNRCIELSSGSWLVKADGDDISLPERVQKLVEKVKENPTATHLVYSGNTRIRKDGTAYATSVQKQHERLDFEADFLRSDAYVLGATCSWSRECATYFGPIMQNLHDDQIFPFRAKLLGEIAFVALPLVQYRMLAGSTVAGLEKPLTWKSLFGLRSALQTNVAGILRRQKTTTDIVRQKIIDLHRFGAPEAQIGILKARCRRLEIQRSCLTGQTILLCVIFSDFGYIA